MNSSDSKAREAFEAWAMKTCPEILIEFGTGPTIQYAKAFAAWTAALQWAASQQAAEGWRPIESAPKDHGVTQFDVWARGERVADCWWGQATYDSKKESGIVYQSDYDCNGPVYSFVVDPTHWRPLPSPPSTQGGADEQR